MNEMQRTTEADCHCAAGRNGVPRQVHFHNNDAQGDADKKSAIGTEQLLDTAARCQGGNGRQREGLGWDNTTNPIAILVHRPSAKKDC